MIFLHFDNNIKRDIFLHFVEPLAQVVEQLPFKQWVAGSSPARLIYQPSRSPSSSLAQDTGLSRRQQGFKSPRGRQNKLFSNNFYKHPFFSSSIKLSIKNLFPGSKIELSGSDCNHDFSAHNLSFHVSVCIIFRIVVLVL